MALKFISTVLFLVGFGLFCQSSRQIIRNHELQDWEPELARVLNASIESRKGGGPGGSWTFTKVEGILLSNEEPFSIIDSEDAIKQYPPGKIITVLVNPETFTGQPRVTVKVPDSEKIVFNMYRVRIIGIILMILTAIVLFIPLTGLNLNKYFSGGDRSNGPHQDLKKDGYPRTIRYTGYRRRRKLE